MSETAMTGTRAPERAHTPIPARAGPSGAPAAGPAPATSLALTLPPGGGAEAAAAVMAAVEKLTLGPDGQLRTTYRGHTLTLAAAQAERVRVIAAEALSNALRRSTNRSELAQGRFHTQEAVNADFPVTSRAVKAWAYLRSAGDYHHPGEALTGLRATMHAETDLARTELAAGHFTAAAQHVAATERASAQAAALVSAYTNDLIEGAESLKTGLEYTSEAAFITLGVLAVVATGGAALGLAPEVIGMGVVGLSVSGTATALSVGAPIVAGVGTAGVAAAYGDKVDWSAVVVDAAIQVVLAKIGGKLGAVVFGKLAGNPATAAVVRRGFASLGSALVVHEASQAFSVAVHQSLNMFRGQNVTWGGVAADLETRLTDPKGLFVAALMGAVQHGIHTKVAAASVSGSESAPRAAAKLRRAESPKTTPATPANPSEAAAPIIGPEPVTAAAPMTPKPVTAPAKAESAAATTGGKLVAATRSQAAGKATSTAKPATAKTCTQLTVEPAGPPPTPGQPVAASTASTPRAPASTPSAPHAAASKSMNPATGPSAPAGEAIVPAMALAEPVPAPGKPSSELTGAGSKRGDGGGSGGPPRSGGGPDLPDDLNFTSEGPLVRVPVTPQGSPASVLEIGAGAADTNLGLPPEPGQANRSQADPGLVKVTRTDINPRPGVAKVDATHPLPTEMHGQDAVIVNNPRGYRVDIATLGSAVKPGGRIVIQGRAEVVPGMRGVNPDMTRVLQDVRAGKVPSGYRVVEVITDPTAASGDPNVVARPPHALGGPFNRTAGDRPVSWPNTRIVIERLPTAPQGGPPGGGRGPGTLPPQTTAPSGGTVTPPEPAAPHSTATSFGSARPGAPFVPPAAGASPGFEEVTAAPHAATIGGTTAPAVTAAAATTVAAPTTAPEPLPPAPAPTPAPASVPAPGAPSAFPKPTAPWTLAPGPGSSALSVGPAPQPTTPGSTAAAAGQTAPSATAPLPTAPGATTVSGATAPRAQKAPKTTATVVEGSGPPQPMNPEHARGYSGEQTMGFANYRQENGWVLIEGSSGAKGHGVTNAGFDAVSYNIRTGELHLTDNKSLAKTGNVGSATAIDPSKNLAQNVDGLITRVEAMKDTPGRIRVLSLLKQTKLALGNGTPLPAGVKLVVTSEGGRTTGVTQRLRNLGVEHLGAPVPAATTPAPTPAQAPPSVTATSLQTATATAAPSAPTATAQAPVKSATASPAAPTATSQRTQIPAAVKSPATAQSPTGGGVKTLPAAVDKPVGPPIEAGVPAPHITTPKPAQAKMTAVKPSILTAPTVAAQKVAAPAASAGTPKNTAPPITASPILNGPPAAVAPPRIGGRLRSIAGSAGMLGAGLLVGLLQSYLRSKVDQHEIEKGITRLWPGVERDLSGRIAEVAALQSQGRTAYANAIVTIHRTRLFMPIEGAEVTESAPMVEKIEVQISDRNISTGERPVDKKWELSDVFDVQTTLTVSFELHLEAAP